MRKRPARPTPPITGKRIGDQRLLRPTRPVRNLDEFLEFLTRLEEVFGPIERPRTLTTGTRFRL